MAVQKFKSLIPTKTENQAPTGSSNEVKTTKPIKESKTEPTVQPALGIRKKEIIRPIDIKFIPREKIIFNKKNDYNQEEIEKLSESILNYGLIHVMEAYYDEENDFYILESGERRTRAIDLLLDKFSSREPDDSYEYQCFLKNVNEFANGYPLNVKYLEMKNGILTELEEINSQLRLDEANQQIRSEDPLQKAKALERRKKLLQRKKELLPKEKMNILNTLAEQTGMTKRSVMKYTAIAEKLIPELQEEFKKSNISLNEGSAYAQLTEEEQNYILQLIRNGEKASKQEIDQLRMLLKTKEDNASQKEIELKRLHAEKEAAEKKLEEEILKKETDKKQLEKRLREEISSEKSSNDSKIQSLKKSLAEKEQELLQNKKTLEEQISLKESDMAALREELKTLKEKPAIDPTEQKALRLSISFDTVLHTLEASAIEAYNIYQELISINPEKSDELKAAYTKAVTKFKK